MNKIWNEKIFNQPSTYQPKPKRLEVVSYNFQLEVFQLLGIYIASVFSERNKFYLFGDKIVKVIYYYTTIIKEWKHF